MYFFSHYLLGKDCFLLPPACWLFFFASFLSLCGVCVWCVPMGDLLLDYVVLVASELWLGQQQNKPSPPVAATATGAAVERPQAWNYSELHSFVQDLPMPAMIVDLDIFDSNIRSVCIFWCLFVCVCAFLMELVVLQEVLRNCQDPWQDHSIGHQVSEGASSDPENHRHWRRNNQWLELFILTLEERNSTLKRQKIHVERKTSHCVFNCVD